MIVEEVQRFYEKKVAILFANMKIFSTFVKPIGNYEIVQKRMFCAKVP